MSTSSILFLSDLTVVDHAYIDHRGNVVGGSFNPSFFVNGELDPVEQVVVDFSAVKKQIKQIIDHKETGFDHKLWFIKGYSHGKITFYGETKSRVLIETPTTILDIPANAVKVLSAYAYNDLAIGVLMGAEVEAGLNELHPVDITVQCVNNTNCHVPTSNTDISLFRYTHGLKDSTSWGCKNIAHGHLSYIQLQSYVDSLTLSGQIAADIDDAVFVNKANIVDDNSATISIAYTVEDRGRFYCAYQKSAYKIFVLETETTVEHLVEYVAAKYHDALVENGVTMLLMSEGLSKGACINIQP